MYKTIISLALALVLSASLSSGAPVGLETVVDEVVARHMSEKQIPGLSVAVVQQQRLVFAKGYGQSSDDSGTQQLVDWSLGRPAQSAPGDNWRYGVVGYVVLGQIFEKVGGDSYASLAQKHVLNALDIDGAFGGSNIVVPGRHPMLYELIEDEVTGHIVDFPERVWPAGGFNVSVVELAKLFIALSGDDFLDPSAKQELWRNITLPNGEDTHYGLGWTSYVTSQNRWVVGHEGGGASWVIYYPDDDLAVIALSNISGARADILPYEIARGSGLLRD